jgi:hypothetical protein
VREALRFSAYLRQPGHVSKEEKDAYVRSSFFPCPAAADLFHVVVMRQVEQCIQLLEMEDLADSMIGFPGFGLGVEARKRLTIVRQLTDLCSVQEADIESSAGCRARGEAPATSVLVCLHCRFSSLSHWLIVSHRDEPTSGLDGQSAYNVRATLFLTPGTP